MTTSKPTTRPSEIGQRVRMIRRRRGMSLETAAGLAGISKPYLSQLENGVRAFERRSLIEKVASALGCSVLDLTGEPYLPTDRASAEGLAAIPGIEEALHDCTLDDVPDLPTRPVDELATAVRAANEQRDLVRYGLAGRELGNLLTELQVAAAASEGPARQTALAALIEACLVAYELSKNLGHPVLGAEAAQRAYDAATQIEDPALAGFAAWLRALSLMRLGAKRRAANTLASGLAIVEPHAGELGLAAEVHGLLHLTSALQLARSGRRDDAHTHLDEAQSVATRTGERNGLLQHFGPTNVAIWRIGIGVELQEGGAVVERAEQDRINPELLGSPNRTAGMHFDLARALSQEGGRRDREAVQHLDTADRVAPSRIRHDPIARSLLESLDSRARVHMWELGSLRHRFGLAASN
jgi:transcriptional regulator with XRE-family HTH domain